MQYIKLSPGIKEGLRLILFFILLFILCVLLHSLFRHILFILLSILLFMLTIFTVYFFRDPDREGYNPEKEIDQNLILSPADGKILEITEMYEPEYLQSSARRISIFMSLFDVHVNRSPIEGKIEFLEYTKGKFFSAFKEKASLENEQLSIGIVKKSPGIPEKKLLFKMIAGFIARRIVIWKSKSDLVKRGERVGMIRFGSCVNLYLPLEAVVMVKRGDHVIAGCTIIAQW